MMTTPGTIICKSWFQPRRMMPLSMTFSTNTPSNVPKREPRPPARLVPPRMTAAMTVSSKPRPSVGADGVDETPQHRQAQRHPGDQENQRRDDDRNRHHPGMARAERGKPRQLVLVLHRLAGEKIDAALQHHHGADRGDQ